MFSPKALGEVGLSRFVCLTLKFLLQAGAWGHVTLYLRETQFSHPFNSLCLFPACSMSLHVRMCACLRLRATLLPACVLCAYVSWCVCACVRVFQESQWLDSVSLLIQDTLEGEMIDNLSGSVFHHYSSPSVCKDCKGHQQEVPRPTLINIAPYRSITNVQKT